MALSAYIFSIAVLPCYPGNTEIVWVKVQACGQTIYNWYFHLALDKCLFRPAKIYRLKPKLIFDRIGHKPVIQVQLYGRCLS